MSTSPPISGAARPLTANCPSTDRAGRASTAARQFTLGPRCGSFEFRLLDAPVAIMACLCAPDGPIAESEQPDVMAENSSGQVKGIYNRRVKSQESAEYVRLQCRRVRDS